LNPQNVLTLFVASLVGCTILPSLL
jgi:hypothetical protein